MKIERIADNAINIYISGEDLASKNLDVKMLREGTHDFDKLIWDAIDHANIEFGHEFEDRQLNVVNKPDGNGGLVLMISHDIDDDYGDNFYYDDENEELMRTFDRILKNAANKKRNSSLDIPALEEDEAEEYEEETDADPESEEDPEDDGAEDAEEQEEEEECSAAEQQQKALTDMANIPPEAFRELFHRIRIQNRNQNLTQQHASGKKHPKSGQPAGNTFTPVKFMAGVKKNPLLANWDVLIFPELNDMLEFFSRNKSFKTISSSLYTYRGAYYLVLKPNSKNLKMLDRLEALVIDYNATYLPAEAFLPLLKERGTILMERGAISKLITQFEL